MTIETLKSLKPRNRNSISVKKSKFLSFSAMNTLLAILKATDERRDVIPAGGLYNRFLWRHLSPPGFDINFHLSWWAAAKPYQKILGSRRSTALPGIFIIRMFHRTRMEMARENKTLLQ